MAEDTKPVALYATDIAPRRKPSSYPEPFASRMQKREKRSLGDYFGLKNFGVNLTRLAPGGVSALRHAHSRQDEFIYVVKGHPTLITDEGQIRLSPEMCVGFSAGTGNAHHLINNTDQDVLYLEVGDRSKDDQVTYPDDDIVAVATSEGWRFLRKDGTPY